MNSIKIFGEPIIDSNAIEQLRNCMTEDSIGVLTADAHKGYTHPIGGAIAYKNQISLSGVGYDIGCGNYAVQTGIQYTDIDIHQLMDSIEKHISFGVGRINSSFVDDSVLDKIKHADFSEQKYLYDLAAKQLGTVGSGNHYINVFKDESGFVWIGVHFGSRGFGHKTTTGFISLSKGLKFSDKSPEGKDDDKPILFDTGSTIGQDYISAMQLAGEYASAGRQAVINKVGHFLGNPNIRQSIHNHHNFAWKENHFGEDYWVVRKGCTPAFPDQYGFIGANMYDTSVIVRGVDSLESKEGLYSTVHGAGRVLSRTKAAGKKRWVKGEDGIKRPTIVSPGLVNFDSVKDMMIRGLIDLRGAGPDEAPECYKNLENVLAYQGDTIEVVHRLKPIGVAMAGSEVYDPYKD